MEETTFTDVLTLTDVRVQYQVPVDALKKAIKRGTLPAFKRFNPYHGKAVWHVAREDAWQYAQAYHTRKRRALSSIEHEENPTGNPT